MGICRHWVFVLFSILHIRVMYWHNIYKGKLIIADKPIWEGSSGSQSLKQLHTTANESIKSLLEPFLCEIRVSLYELSHDVWTSDNLYSWLIGYLWRKVQFPIWGIWGNRINGAVEARLYIFVVFIIKFCSLLFLWEKSFKSDFTSLIWGNHFHGVMLFPWGYTFQAIISLGKAHTSSESDNL